MNLICKDTKGKLKVDVMDEGRMYVVDGEELTPLEVTKLALYYVLNLEHAGKEENKGQEV